MIPYSLEDIELYNILQHRRDKVSKMFSGLLIPISGDAAELLEYIKKSYPKYTTHNIQHSWRILKRIDDILPKKTKESLSSLEIFSLIIAAIFHDTGMIDAAEIKDHPDYSEIFLKKYFTNELKIIQDYTSRLVECIGFIIRSHGLSWELMKSAELFKLTEKILDQPLRVNILCILLRLGDLLDLDAERTPEAVRQYAIGNTLDDNSIAHHLRHRKLSHFNCNSEYIEITVEPDSREQHLIWAQWLNYIEQEILYANTYVFKEHDLPTLPVPNLIINKNKNASYELWPLRFEIDKKGRIWEVVSQSVYTGKFDFIRELIQNGIDATLTWIYINESSKITGHIPRMWSLSDYHPFVLVFYSEKKNTLSVIDNGIGMSKQSLQDYLFTVAEAGFSVQKIKRNISFPSIAKFGIGFVACLVRADTISIQTKERNASSFGQKVLLQTNCSEAYLEKENCFNGTKIELILQKKYKEREINSYIDNYFRYPSVPIVYINKDRMEEFALYSSELLKGRKSSNLISILTETELYERTNKKGATHLIKTFERIARLNRSTLKRMESGFEKLDALKDYYLAHIPQRVYGEIPKKIYLMKLGEDFEVDVVFREIKKLSGGISIMWIPVQYTDEKIGIDWVSFHGFLIKDNVIVSSVIRYTGVANEYDDTEKIRYIESGKWDDQDFEDLYEEPEDMVDVINKRAAQFKKHLTSSNAEEGQIIYTTIDNIVTSDLEDYYNETNMTNHDKSDLTFRKNRIQSASVKQMDLLRHLQPLDNRVYQDGIELPLLAYSIAPLGACRAQCNFTGNSRLELNVSRNAINESPNLLSVWANEIGFKIQEKVIESVIKVFKKTGVSFNINSMINSSIRKDSLSEYTRPILKKILSTYK